MLIPPAFQLYKHYATLDFNTTTIANMVLSIDQSFIQFNITYPKSGSYKITATESFFNISSIQYVNVIDATIESSFLGCYSDINDYLFSTYLNNCTFMNLDLCFQYCFHDNYQVAALTLG